MARNTKNDSKKQWDYYFEQKEKEEKVFEELVFKLNSKEVFDTNILKAEEDRSYGNKYIKRRHR